MTNTTPQPQGGKGTYIHTHIDTTPQPQAGRGNSHTPGTPYPLSDWAKLQPEGRNYNQKVEFTTGQPGKRAKYVENLFFPS